MVHNASPPERRVGRKPGFDRDAVIGAAIRPFWTKGFTATTLGDIEQAAGVDRSTLYNSFGGKRGIYGSAAAAYVDGAEEHLFAPLNHGDGGISSILDFIDRVGGSLFSGVNPRGCLIVNDLNSAGDPNATHRYLNGLRDGLAAALDRAGALGEIDPESSTQRVQFLSAAILGVNLASKSVSDQGLARSLLAGIRQEISTWLV
jgi:TetR/AcrR family transcriptional repressor of nem operon